MTEKLRIAHDAKKAEVADRAHSRKDQLNRATAGCVVLGPHPLAGEIT